MKHTPASKSSQWTPADQAELDVLTYELVDAYFAHRPNCDQCLAWDERLTGSHPCHHLQAAIGIVIDWRTKRELRTAAEELRLERNAQLGDVAA